MPRRISIAVFIDACGWDVITEHPSFLRELCHRQPVESVFGYSSACVPTILSGRLPDENDHWSFWRYAPESSPFSLLSHLPHAVDKVLAFGLAKRLASRLLARAMGIRGYFELYSMPLTRLPEFDWSEKKNLFHPGGMNRGRSIFDDLVDRGVPAHVSDWRRPEKERLAAADSAVETGEPRFVWLYLADLDGLMHRHGRSRAHVAAKLAYYEQRIRRLVRIASRTYDDVRVSVFSDHGMANVHTVVDLRADIDALGLEWGRDYAAIYDSTMARFWFLSKRGEERIRAVLTDGPVGAWVTEEEERAWGVHWPDGRFGDAFYALRAGCLLCPSDLGDAPLAGMHGYRPDDEDSFAALIADRAPDGPVEKLTDIYGLLGEMCDWSMDEHRLEPAA